MLTEEEINNAYQYLWVTKKTYEEKETARIELKIDLESQMATDVASGEITGKNDVERRGQFEIKYPENTSHLTRLTIEASEAKLELDLASIEISRIRALLRLAEVMARLEPEEE